jgi:hypothetical protein
MSRSLTRSVALLIAVAGLALASPAPALASGDLFQGASPPPAIPGKNNAALLYYQAWQSIDDQVRNQVNTGEADDATLVKHQPYIEALLRAAETRECDWGLRYEEGIELLLPHLGRLRGTARTFRTDADRLLDVGGEENQRQAARRIGALYSMAMHIRTDRILISSLVCQAIAALGNSVVDENVQQNKLTVSNAQTILNAMRAMPKQDTFGVKDSVLGERDIFIEWIRNTFKGDKAGADFIARMGSSVEAGNPAANQIATFDEKQMLAQIEKILPYYDAVLKAWDDPEGLSKLEELEASIKTGEYGALATIILPTFRAALISNKRFSDETTHTIKMLEAYIASNAVVPEEFKSKPKDESAK